MIKKAFCTIIEERIRIGDETDNNWDYGIEQCWKKEIEILTKDIKTTMDFINSDCTDEELYWMSEVFEEIVQKTQSKDFLNCLRERVKIVEAPEYSERINEEIHFAEMYLDDEIQ